MSKVLGARGGEIAPGSSSPATGSGAGGRSAYLPVPDVGGQHLILLILGKKREFSIGGPVGWGSTLHTPIPKDAVALCPYSFGK